MQSKRTFLLIIAIAAAVGASIAIFISRDDNVATATKQEKPQTEKDNQSAETYYGIDVSHWNGDILTDIDKADNISFGICKATEGIDDTDPDYSQNRELLQKHQLTWGAYHFLMVDDDPVAQAEFYYKTMGAKTGSKQMTYIVDVEAGSLSTKDRDATTIQKVLLTFLKHMESLTNETPMIYTNYSFANEFLTDSTLSHYPLWLAEYSGGTTLKIPEVWKEKGYTIWQKSDTYDISSSHVDYDEYHGVLSEL